MDSDESRLWYLILFILIVLLIKGFFTACETAVTEINDNKLKAMAETNKKAERLYTLLKTPNKLFTTFSIQRIMSAALISILSGIAFFTPLSKIFLDLTNISVLSDMLSACIVVLLTTIAMVVFCDSLPKKLVIGENDNFALNVSGILKILTFILAPISIVVFFIIRIFAKLIGINMRNENDSVTEEEILMMVDVGNETGVIEESQREMINNIFEFGDLAVSDIMTHRIDLSAVDITDKIADVVYLAINKGFSRIPVYQNTIDNIVGIICVKDLLCLVGCENTAGFSITDFLRPVLSIPETNKCSEVLKKLTGAKNQVAVAVDEYGGTAGIVTVEDLLEAIVGDIQDEYDDETEEIIKIVDGMYTIDGMADPESIFEELGATLPPEHNYDTMGGLIVDLLGRIPTDGENLTVVYQNITFTVLIIKDKRVVKLKAVINPHTSKSSGKTPST